MAVIPSDTIASSSKDLNFPHVEGSDVIWVFIPLAISVMTQPCGRVCGTSVRYRTYLRCSPVICLADLVSIQARLLLYMYYCIAGSMPWFEGLTQRGHLSPYGFLKTFVEAYRYSLNCIITARFNDMDEEERQTEGLHAVENMTWLRWLFFFLGTLGPTIKLFAMQGITWSVAWGSMFFASFIVIDILLVFSWKGLHEDIEMRFSIDGISVLQERRGDIIDRSLFFVACSIHAFILVLVIGDIWPQFEKEACVNTTGNLCNSMERISIVIKRKFFTSVFVAMLFGLYRCVSILGSPLSRDTVDLSLWLFVLLATSVWGITCMVLFTPLSIATDLVQILVCFVPIVALVHWFAPWFCDKFPRLAETFLLTCRYWRARSEEISPDTSAWWSFFWEFPVYLHSLYRVVYTQVRAHWYCKSWMDWDFWMNKVSRV